MAGSSIGRLLKGWWMHIANLGIAILWPNLKTQLQSLNQGHRHWCPFIYGYYHCKGWRVGESNLLQCTDWKWDAWWQSKTPCIPSCTVAIIYCWSCKKFCCSINYHTVWQRINQYIYHLAVTPGCWLVGNQNKDSNVRSR